MHWRFLRHGYLGVIHKNTRNGYEKQKCVQTSSVPDPDNMTRVKEQTSGQVIKTIGQTIVFLLRLQKHGGMIEKLVAVFERISLKQTIGQVFLSKGNNRNF